MDFQHNGVLVLPVFIGCFLFTMWMGGLFVQGATYTSGLQGSGYLSFYYLWSLLIDAALFYKVAITSGKPKRR